MDGFENVKKYLDKIERDSLDKYLRVCYNVLISSPSQMLLYDADTQLKLKGINKLIMYFEEKEEFEKCVELKRLRDML
jgi:hypothetical protein